MSDESKIELSDDDFVVLKKELKKSFQNYMNTISYMSGDAPIETLCLSKCLQNKLIDAGCLRIYDLFNCDLTKIKGIGKVGIGQLTTRLDQFLSMG